MKTKSFCTLIILLVSPLLLLQSLYAQGEDKATEHAFVGASTCGMCHKSEKQGKQFVIWQESKHAQAYKTLQSEKADEIAKKAGFTTKAVETEACLKCHASGYNVDASLKGAKFSVEDGVQCETCHGAGADYKSLKVMKDKKEAIANGLVEPGDLKTFCAGCHNPDSPTFVARDVDEMWAKIKHPIPGK